MAGKRVPKTRGLPKYEMGVDAPVHDVQGADTTVIDRVPTNRVHSDTWANNLELKGLIASKYANAGPVAPGAGPAMQPVVQISESDIAEHRKHLAETDRARFDAWIRKYFNQYAKDPANFAKMSKMFPDLIKERKKTIKDISQMQLRAALIALCGPQSEEDMALIWMVQDGALKIPEFAPHLLVSGEAAEVATYITEHRYKPGMIASMLLGDPIKQEVQLPENYNNGSWFTTTHRGQVTRNTRVWDTNEYQPGGAGVAHANRYTNKGHTLTR